jgi:hypothetical protein
MFWHSILVTPIIIYLTLLPLSLLKVMVKRSFKKIARALNGKIKSSPYRLSLTLKDVIIKMKWVELLIEYKNIETPDLYVLRLDNNKWSIGIDKSWGESLRNEFRAIIDESLRTFKRTGFDVQEISKLDNGDVRVVLFYYDTNGEKIMEFVHNMKLLLED